MKKTLLSPKKWVKSVTKVLFCVGALLLIGGDGKIHAAGIGVSLMPASINQEDRSSCFIYVAKRTDGTIQHPLKKIPADLIVSDKEATPGAWDVKNPGDQAVYVSGKIKRSSVYKVPNGAASMASKFSCGTLGLPDVLAVMLAFINGLVKIAGIAFFTVMTMFAAYQGIIGSATSGGNEQGKTTIKNVIVGSLVMVSAWQAVDWLQRFLTSVA